MMNEEHIRNMSNVVGDAFEDMSELEMLQNQGLSEIQPRSWGAAGVSFAINWNVSNAIFR